MGLLKRILREKKESSLLKRAVIIKNYEMEPAEPDEEKKNSPPSTRNTSPGPKRT